MVAPVPRVAVALVGKGGKAGAERRDPAVAVAPGAQVVILGAGPGDLRLSGLVDEDHLTDFLMSSTGPVIILDNASHPFLQGDEAQSSLTHQRVAVTARCHTRISRHAELVMPAASWVETEGSYTSKTGRVQLARRAFAPRGQARPVWQILALLAAEMGLESQSTTTVRTIFESLATEIPSFAGMTYKRMKGSPGLPVLEEAPHAG